MLVCVSAFFCLHVPYDNAVVFKTSTLGYTDLYSIRFIGVIESLNTVLLSSVNGSASRKKLK